MQVFLKNNCAKMKTMFYKDRVWGYLKEYLKDRIVAYSYCASPDKMVFHRYRPETIKQGIKGKPYINLSRKEFDDTYFNLFDWDKKTGGLPSEKVTGIHATLSRYSQAPTIKKDFYSDLLPGLKSKDVGYDLDTGIKSVSEINKKFLEKCYVILQPVWESLAENGLKPTLKYSGSGFHIVSPITAPKTENIAETVHKASRYIAELGLSEIKCEYGQNKFTVSDEKYAMSLEVQKDLNRLYTVPFSPYVKRHKSNGTEFENKVLLCIPLKEPSDILDFKLERATPRYIDEIKIPKYPEPVKIRRSLISEAVEHYEKLERKEQRTYVSCTPNNGTGDVSIDNLPPKYKHLESGVSEGSRDNSIIQLLGVFKTCGLSEHETLSELLAFNKRCRPSLPESVVTEKVRRIY